MDKVTLADLFCGIGGFHTGVESACRRAGVDFSCAVAYEKKVDVRKVYGAKYGLLPDGDIRQADVSAMPDFNVLTAGFPCQPFSVLNKTATSGENHHSYDLKDEIIRVAASRRPAVVFLENVPALVGSRHRDYFNVILGELEAIGYHVKWALLNAHNFGVVQSRLRLFVVGFLDGESARLFEFPNGEPCKHTLADVLDGDVKLETILKTGYYNHFARGKRFQKVLKGNEIVCYCLTSSKLMCDIAIRDDDSITKKYDAQWLFEQGRQPYLRCFSSDEALRLQGFKPDFFDGLDVPYSRRLAMVGNSVSPPVVEAVFSNVLRAMDGEQCELFQGNHKLMKITSLSESIANIRELPR